MVLQTMPLKVLLLYRKLVFDVNAMKKLLNTIKEVYTDIKTEILLNVI